MRYQVTLAADIGGAPSTGAWEVDVVDRPDGSVEVHVGGRKVDVDVVPFAHSPGRSNVRVDGRIVDLTVAGKPPDLLAVASGLRVRARVESERSRTTAQGERRPARGTTAVRSPMPGRVIKVLAAAGDVVTAGQALVVLEAMKMENEVRAAASGTVAQVHVAVGAAVESNAVLVTIAGPA
ncbi:MAG TPA: biotin/lipoyl-containing protein [Polyangiaceae bacterium]|jgi:biotin carboxyl carrier protein